MIRLAGPNHFTAGWFGDERTPRLAGTLLDYRD